MESCLKIGGDYWHGLGDLLYKMGKISTLSRATTLNTTTTHNNQHEPPPPYPSVALALSLHGQAGGATNQWCHCFIGPMQGAHRPWSGLAARWLVCLFGAPKRDALKNREMGWALDLGGRRYLESAEAIMGMLEQRRVCWRAHGETPFHRLGQIINKHEIHHGLRQPLINNGSHHNQPKTGSRDGGKYGEDVRQAGRVGEVQYHHFGGVVS